MFFDSWDASLWSMFLIGAGEGELGLAVAREAVTSSPTFGPAHLALGAALEYEGQRRGSVQAFQASFSCDPPLESIFGGIVDRLAEGNDPVAAARELARLEEIGIVCMHVPFVELYRRRFRPQDAPLPLGIYAPTQRSYEQACGMFARNARRSTSLTEAGEAHLEFLKLLWASGL
jgi:hypothetical protein